MTKRTTPNCPCCGEGFSEEELKEKHMQKKRMTNVSVHRHVGVKMINIYSMFFK
ncbi:MAG: hypothetical protein KKD46_00335 [Euryarchaeota archaeon]|nr:hypothetical protein [Euryarchaeota archaeon]MBU4339359.1 hypothetical protein [Euryarchaeota archaeon]MCG2735729.1 hypothetical protein [Candidatus Methanoperedenaceae archaeon]